MTCSTAEGMVNRYINHTLSVEELGDFLEHIESCSSCYDELETYFIVHEAMQQLDEEEEGPVLDFQHLLEQDIKKSRHYIYKKKAFRLMGAFLVLVLIGVLMTFFVFIVLELKQFL